MWLYATLRGVGSARELARRCGKHGEVPFQWICGGVSVNDHTLSDFRTQHVEFLDGVLTDSVTALLEQELVEMDRVAQDDMCGPVPGPRPSAANRRWKNAWPRPKPRSKR